MAKFTMFLDTWLREGVGFSKTSFRSNFGVSRVGHSMEDLAGESAFGLDSVLDLRPRTTRLMGFESSDTSSILITSFGVSIGW
jgi:hypothetical protein